MTEPKDLVLVNEQLRRSNRRWKAVALAACLALAITAIGSFVAAAMQRMRLEHQRRAAAEAFARANAALNQGQPR